MHMRQQETANKINPNGMNGFSLIEVMIGLAIFSIGILAVVSMQVSSLNATSKARGLMEASEWAEERIERLVGMPYDQIVSDPVGVTEGSYNISWVVSGEGEPFDNMKTVIVIVRNVRNQPREITLTYFKQNL